MQLWQKCIGASPIAGIRISKADPYLLNFMTRSDHDRVKGSTAFMYKVKPGKWTTFVVRIQADPANKKGSLKLWADDVEIGTFRSSIGYAPESQCEGGNASNGQFYRLKFGIYKGPDIGKKYEVRYRQLSLGNDYHAVVPKK